MNIMRSLYSKGYDEDLSTSYTATHLSPYFILYDCATDPQVKSAADAAITFKISHMAANHFEGIVIPPFNRENSPQFNKHNGGAWNPVLQWIYWLYWGEVQNRVPTPSNFRSNQENRWFIHAALSDWRPSAAINSLAFGQTVPYELTSTKPNHVHFGAGGAGVYERYVYRDKLYAMGSGNLRFRPNGYYNDYNMFGLIYKSEFTYNYIDCHHHYWRSNHRIWKGASPFIQMAQHKSTAIILFDIPDTDPWFDRGNDGWKNLRNNHFNNLIKEGLLRYPKSINEKVEASGWIFLRHGDVYIAIRPLKDYAIVTNYSTLMTKTGNQSLDTYVDVALYYNVVRSAFAQTGFVIDVATKEEFASFAAFQSAVSAKTVSVDWTNFSVSYTNLRGDNLTARWNAPVPDYKDVPDSHEGNVNAQVWIRPNFTINSTAVAIDSDFTDAKAVIKSSSIELVNRALQINTAGDPFSVNWSGTDPIFSAGTTTYYTVSYNANGGTGTIPNALKTHDVPLTLSNGSGFSRTGYTFSGWNTAANGSGTNYAAGESYNENESVTLYAMWTTAAIYTVSYNANGGTGTIENATKTHSVDLTLSDGSGFSRTGYIFIGWNTAANGSGTNYDPGALYTENEDVMLFAWWRDASPGGTSPLVHYKGDLTGSGFPDSSGRDNHGTAGGATQTTTTAKIGNTAMFIGGGNSSIDLPANHADFNRTYEAFTLSMWVNPGAGDDVTGGSMTWFAGKMGGSSGDRGWQIGRRNASQADFRQMHFGYSEDAVGTWGGLNSKSIVPVDQWTHFAVTFAGDQFVRMYINGVLDEEVINSAETPVRARINGVNNAIFQVGNRGENHSLSTLGHIDDFGLWDVALTGEQIQRIYSKGNMAGLDLQTALGADTYTVSYDANGGEGSIADDIKIHDEDLTLSDGSGFNRTGYILLSWNTAADGSGTNYYASGTYTVNADITLYAIWTTSSYTVSYDANGGEGSIADDIKIHDVDLTLSDGSGFSRTGYAFSGWNTSADGSGTSYDAGAMYTINAGQTFFAKWTVNTYTVSYDANGGTGSIANATKTHDVDLTLSDGTGFSRTGNTFSGWNTSADGSGTSYDASGTYTVNADVTLYAIWTTSTYIVSYDANGGTGTIANATKTHDVDLTLSDGTGFSRTDYDFVGWNTEADGSGMNYDASSIYSANADVTLYARWNLSVAVNKVVFDEISIYPNPAADRVYFNNLPENSRIVLVDLLGRNIIEKNASELSDGLSLQPYTNGYYLIRVIHGQEFVKTVKVLKK